MTLNYLPCPSQPPCTQRHSAARRGLGHSAVTARYLCGPGTSFAALIAFANTLGGKPENLENLENISQ